MSRRRNDHDAHTFGKTHCLIPALSLLQGAAATDSVEGSRTSEIAACKPAFKFSAYGLRGCGLDTRQPGNHTVDFILEDAAGAVSRTVSRTVVVLPDCSGEDTCSDLKCAQGGLCLSGSRLELPVNAPPTLRFTHGSSPARSIARGQPYVGCGGAARAAVACEEGPIASDAEDGGQMTTRILACPPDSCLWQGCPGHEFAEKGAHLHVPSQEHMQCCRILS